jgi:hypothetical protein
LEERILLIAEVTARSRQQRRERERRKREASLGSGGSTGSGWGPYTGMANMTFNLTGVR